MTPEQFAAKMSAAAEKLRSAQPLMDKIGQVALARSLPKVPIRTGELYQSVGMRSDATTATLYATAEHAGFVHEGTSRMAARPFLRMGIEDSLGEIEDLVRQFGEDVLAGVSG